MEKSNDINTFYSADSSVSNQANSNGTLSIKRQTNGSIRQFHSSAQSSFSMQGQHRCAHAHTGSISQLDDQGAVSTGKVR